MSQATNFTTPPGRLVAGSPYKPKTTDLGGRPLTVKSGPNAGQPKTEYFFALAIPKGSEAAHGPLGWMATPWGAIIRQAGEQFVASAASMPAFAWKIKDGDSQVPNQANRKPCDNEGWPGHWVLMYSSGFAPKCYTLIGGLSAPALLDQVDAINLGDYVQVAGSVAANDDRTKPGVYLNHSMVCHVAYGQRIVVGPNVAEAGFGGAALPAGAMMAPPAGFTPPVAGAPTMPAIPGAPTLPPPAVPGALPPALPPAASSLMPPPVVPAVPATPPAYPAAAPAAIVPNHAILQPPVGTVPPPLPVAPVRQLTAKANGASYEQLIAAGWTDAALVANGLMAA